MVYHVLKDGSTPSDITGKVIKVKDEPSLYEMLKRLSYETKKQNT